MFNLTTPLLRATTNMMNQTGENPISPGEAGFIALGSLVVLTLPLLVCMIYQDKKRKQLQLTRELFGTEGSSPLAPKKSRPRTSTYGSFDIEAHGSSR